MEAGTAAVAAATAECDPPVTGPYLNACIAAANVLKKTEYPTTVHTRGLQHFTRLDQVRATLEKPKNEWFF
jgi:hypothetical protein